MRIEIESVTRKDHETKTTVSLIVHVNDNINDSVSMDIIVKWFWDHSEKDIIVKDWWTENLQNEGAAWCILAAGLYVNRKMDSCTLSEYVLNEINN